ncbi:protein SMAX1-LIKE 6-like [Arachis stenosperma]|uniref:protein SMAX1-LIKE 6-like n=1 Tax=Arachis stenosperma TaxID=217475 RepID=UPI0025ABE8C6|nr:protein SMAX1-LIKE 6-like [Arachis stenosperma]
MPTPVSAARQCLTDEAARALDDAVAVARRRSHAQTTSLHAVSALLALPSSSLRDAITRSRTVVTAVAAAVTVSPRLQLRALELSVGVSLDRLPSSKPSSTSSTADDDGPPVSNSLMAAIKRSQANQRRHPDTFHLMQIHNHQNPQFNQGTASFLKVELKHFVLSILDDPIVSRVFGEAGFRSPDIKLALLQPPNPPPSSRIFSRTRYPPPLFLCSLESGRPGPGFSSGFPFLDENCRRVADILTRKNKRNPLLMGVYAKTALRSFVEMIEKGRGVAMFPPEMAAVNVISVENEIQEFLISGAMSEEKMGLRFEELGREAGQCSNGGGVVVSFGDVGAFVKDGVDSGAVGFVLSRITRLLLDGGGGGGKVWLVGVAEKCDVYSKLLGLFPNVEKDWDLYPITVTSATPSMEGLYPKSSLMGSFIPFGGFFSTPPEIKTPVSCSSASSARCDECNEKYEEEVADLKVNEESTSLNERILGCQKKWNDICRNLHHTRSVDNSQTRPQAPSLEGLRFGSGFTESGSKDPSHIEVQYSNQTSYLPREPPSIYPLKQLPSVLESSDAASISSGTDHALKFSGIQLTDVRTPWIAPSSMANTSLLDHSSSSSLTPVMTDLGLGTIYTSAAQEPDTPKLQDHKKHLPNLSESLSIDFFDAPNENTSHQTPRSACSFPNSEGNFDSVDLKSLNQLLAEKVGWQDDAIYAINRRLFLCNSGAGKCKGSRAGIWFAFLGPDRISKKKIAAALAEIIFGNRENLISVDLSLLDRSFSLNSVFDCQISHCHDALRRKTVVDYIAGELSKRPLSVVFLDHVDKADYLVQTSLSQALKTGKFPDSHGREISINNRIFIVASTVSKGNSNSSSISEGSKMFSEERILEAKKFQMQLILGHTASEDAIKRGITNVQVIRGKGSSKPPFLSKRKQADTNDSKEVGNTCKMQKQVREKSRSYLDLNMPLNEAEECINDNDNEMENSGACSTDICNQIEEKVLFKPFNFDALADELLKSISTQFQRALSSDFQLEIEYDVMVQILAAAWLSEKKNAVEDWIERVLGRAFAEAKQKKHRASPSQYVMKLVNCESNFVEENAPGGLCLPSRINLN